MKRERPKSKQQFGPRAMGPFVFITAAAILLVTSGLLLAGNGSQNRRDFCDKMSRADQRQMKETLIKNYGDLKQKYLQQRNLSDCLLQPIVGSADWRDHITFANQEGKFKPAFCMVFHETLPGLPAKILDWSWNHMDTTQYLGWSVYHSGWEWLTPPDKYGFGAFNVGWQDAPGRGGELEAAFASWDNPQPYIDFPLEYEYAMLMRFWSYDPVEQQFIPTGEAILLEWQEAPGGGTQTQTKILSLYGQDCPQFAEGDFSFIIHEQEEIGSWTMADLEMAWRKDFDSSSYRPQWKVTQKTHQRPKSDRDPGNVQLFSDTDLQKMDVETLQKVYDGLWQTYLGIKMIADYALHYYDDNPNYTKPECSQIYLNNFIPKP